MLSVEKPGPCGGRFLGYQSLEWMEPLTPRPGLTAAVPGSSLQLAPATLRKDCSEYLLAGGRDLIGFTDWKGLYIGWKGPHRPHQLCQMDPYSWWVRNSPGTVIRESRKEGLSWFPGHGWAVCGED